MKLARQLYSARTFLDDGQLVDCQRLLDGYWPRYLGGVSAGAASIVPGGIGPTPPVSVGAAGRTTQRGLSRGAAAGRSQAASAGAMRSALPRVFRR